MSTKSPYSFTVLRYMHDIATGEFLNVGVALLAPERRYVGALCRTTFQRLKNVFPTLDGESFRSSMRHVTHEFERFQQELRDESSLPVSKSIVMDYAHAVLGADDSSLQWSPMGSGLTVDPERTLEQLYERLVMVYDKHTAAQRRQDDDVWRHFSHELQQRQVLKHFVPKTIAVRDDQLEFKHAWKNGVWHCLVPVSFDLASPESIREKAHRWLGQLTSVAKASEPFKLYFLVGRPSHDELMPAFESALSILGKAPVNREVFSETEVQALSERLAAEIQAHQRASATN
ncbi:MAG TPA: DUF3037 domain-containing protein [Alphaproteobacteria bacterium]|nr:DUF3037 domain-containing protein [Alphaproteobacteria bacterium]